MKTRNIERRRLGEQVADVLGKQIAGGKYPAGMHLSEIHLCTELGVSRTPVREALFKLEEKGLVISHPNRGFFIAPLRKHTVREHYPILAALDALALRTSRKFTADEVAALEALNARMAKSGKSAPEMYQLDLDFHDNLINKCENRQLLSLIETLKAQTRRYDGGYKRGLADRKRAHREHVKIIAAIKTGNNEKAAALLEKHWLGGIETVTGWIDSQET